MITRTITTTTYEVMCVNTEQGTVTTEQVTLSGEAMEEVRAMKIIKCAITHVMPVKIMSHNSVTKLYGMSDNDFIKYATLIKEGGR